jgi:DNA-binding CsgD family transcriptional regulator
MLSPDKYSGERPWHVGILEPLTRLIGCHKSGIRRLDQNGQRWTEYGFDHDDAIPKYKAYYHRFDHGRALNGPEVRSWVNSSIRHFEDRLPQFHRSEFYCDYLKPFEFFDSMTLSTRRREQEKASALYVWHGRELTSFERARAIALLGLLGPAFRSGMRMSKQLSSGRAPFYALLDRLIEGCALFTQSGVLLHQNPALTAIHAGALAPRALSQTIANSVASVRESCFGQRGEVTNPHALSVDERGPEGTYRISGSLLEHSPSGTEAAILVTVTFASTSDRTVPSVLLRERFGLTSRESEVTPLLVARRTNREIAHRLGMSVHTARHHTENIMRKIGVASRADISSVLVESSEKPGNAKRP